MQAHEQNLTLYKPKTKNKLGPFVIKKEIEPGFE